jgi:hypothetical protein
MSITKNYGLSGLSSQVEYGKGGGSIFYDAASQTFSVRQIDTALFAPVEAGNITAKSGDVSITDTNGKLSFSGTTLSLQQANVLKFDGNSAISIPVGNDSQRPSSPIVGMIRINNEAATPVAEYYDGTAWTTVGTGSASQVQINGTDPISVSFNADVFTISLSSVSGTGSVVLSNSPILLTPNLGTPSAVTLTNASGLPVSTGLTGLGVGVANALASNVGTTGSFIVSGGALGTPGSATLTNATGLPISTGVSGLGTGVATALAVNIGTPGAVLINGGDLGTPNSLNLTNATGLPISTGVSGLGAEVAAFLATPTSQNLANAVTDETGTGSLVFSNSPTLVTPNLGTPSSINLTNATGLSLDTGVSGVLPIDKGGTGKSELAINQILYGGSGTSVGQSVNLSFNPDNKDLIVGGNSPLKINGDTATIGSVNQNSNINLIPNGTGKVVLSGTGGTALTTNPGEQLNLVANQSNVIINSTSGNTTMALATNTNSKVTVSGPTAAQYSSGLADSDLVNKYYVDNLVSSIIGGSF